MDLCVRLENSSTALSPAIEWLRLPRSIKKPAGPGVGLKKGGAQSRLGERATFRLSYVLWGECRTSQEWSMWIRGRDAAQAKHCSSLNWWIHYRFSSWHAQEYLANFSLPSSIPHFPHFLSDSPSSSSSRALTPFLSSPNNPRRRRHRVASSIIWISAWPYVKWYLKLADGIRQSNARNVIHKPNMQVRCLGSLIWLCTLTLYGDGFITNRALILLCDLDHGIMLI